MSDSWIPPFSREPSFFPWRRNIFSSFYEVRRMFDEMDKMFNFPCYCRDTQVGGPFKFDKGCDEIFNKDGDLSIKMDVTHFGPNELKVDVIDRCLIVQGNHGERNDNYGSIQRMFVRKYILPNGIKENDVICELTRDGFLTIKAKNQKATEGNKIKNILITYK
uniref:Protein lethal(2)essential for life (inferred by orthology to a D. melanogaster protein) n=1 Tax=Strongyloides venezuelensis TaxID=75913 RepID=A0A0K0FAS1_STRVS